jgi:hypothetical protein
MEQNYLLGSYTLVSTTSAVGKKRKLCPICPITSLHFGKSLYIHILRDCWRIIKNICPRVKVPLVTCAKNAYVQGQDIGMHCHG